MTIGVMLHVSPMRVVLDHWTKSTSHHGYIYNVITTLNDKPSATGLFLQAQILRTKYKCQLSKKSDESTNSDMLRYLLLNSTDYASTNQGHTI